MQSTHGPKIWFHCASLGEFEQARPLIELVRKLHPQHKIILTFFSSSGYDVRRNYEYADFIGYLPLDTKSSAEKLINIMKPSLVIWVKYEFWFHHLFEINRRGIPIILISSVFRPDQVFFRWYGGLHRSMLGFFKNIFVQNQQSQHLLQSIGIGSEVCRDTRFDSVVKVMERHKKLDGVQKFKGEKKLIVAGSTWLKDAEIICRLINEDPFNGQFRYIIAPHDVEKENVNAIIRMIQKPKALLSRVTLYNADSFEVAVTDSMGLLSSLYFYADIAYIGGGFGAGIHNILEPAVYGMPVIFGPRYQKSAEALEMAGHPEWNAAFSISNYESLVETIKYLLEGDGSKLKIGSEKTREYVLANVGGTDQVYQRLVSENLL